MARESKHIPVKKGGWDVEGATELLLLMLNVSFRAWVDTQV